VVKTDESICIGNKRYTHCTSTTTEAFMKIAFILITNPKAMKSGLLSTSFPRSLPSKWRVLREECDKKRPSDISLRQPLTPPSDANEHSSIDRRTGWHSSDAVSMLTPQIGDQLFLIRSSLCHPNRNIVDITHPSNFPAWINRNCSCVELRFNFGAISRGKANSRRWV
jgi:hypothetical protein